MKPINPPSLLANMITIYLEDFWDGEKDPRAGIVMDSLRSLDNDGWNEPAVKAFQNAIGKLEGLTARSKIDFIELLIKNYKTGSSKT